MKKVTLLWIGLLLAAGLVIYLITYLNTYSMSAIPEEIAEVLEHKTQASVTVKQTSVADDKVCFVFTLSQSVGTGSLTRGWNGKYKLDYFGYGTNEVRDRVVHTNKGSYLMLAGRNQRQIASIKAVLDGAEYEVKLPEEEFYLLLTPVGKTDRSFAEQLTLTDRSGDILH